jgi:branched-chain amino acid transport system substrate-binding protein
MPNDTRGDRGIRWRAVAAALGLAVVTATLAACGDPAPIRVGFIGGLSGRSADTGEASRNAVQLAVDEANRSGGIGGRRLELLVRDDTDDPAVAAQAVRELHAEGVVAIIGPNNSSIAEGMLPVLNQLKLVTISPTVSSLAFADLDDHFFRINWTTRDNARLYAEHYIGRGIRRIAATTDANNAVFSESWLREFRAAFEPVGGEVVAHERFDANGPRGYSQTVQTLLDSRADAILLVANSVDAAQFAHQVRKLDRDILLIAAEWAASERLLILGGRAIEGLELVQSYDRHDTSPAYQRFREAYTAGFRHEPGFSSVAAHDAATVLFRALALGSDGGSLKDALLGLDTTAGLQQPVRFNRYGDAQRQAFFVVVRSGRFEGL